MSDIVLAPEERAMILGDLSQLSPPQRADLVMRICADLGLNPRTRPFEYLTLNGKLVLYARKDATEQLRARPGKEVSVRIVSREVTEGCYVVTAQATMVASGRQDESIGAVPIENLKGEARSNAMMKAETKAKRRVTLSICGLGMLDESEVDSIPGARVVETPQTALQAPTSAPTPRGIQSGLTDRCLTLALKLGVVPSLDNATKRENVIDLCQALDIKEKWTPEVAERTLARLETMNDLRDSVPPPAPEPEIVDEPTLFVDEETGEVFDAPEPADEPTNVMDRAKKYGAVHRKYMAMLKELGGYEHEEQRRQLQELVTGKASSGEFVTADYDKMIKHIERKLESRRRTS